MYLKSFLLSKFDFKENEIEEISGNFRKVAINEGDFLLKKGEISKEIFLIESGIVREYIVNNDVEESFDDQEITYWILGDKEIVYQVESYVMQTPSKCYLQALSNVKAYCITKEQLEELLEKVPALYKVVIKLYENYLLQLEQRNYLHKIKRAERRLEVFEQNNSDMLNKVKLRHIASFLNISSSEFSRIRSRRAKKS